MPRVKQSDIEQLKDRVDIVEVIGTYISLKTAGPGSFKGLCPFHGEKTPSFHVRSSPAFITALVAELVVTFSSLSRKWKRLVFQRQLRN